MPNIKAKKNIDNNIDFEKNWLNSSLQIIASCKELKTVLDSYTNIHSKLLIYKIKNIINTILNDKELNSDDLINYFSQKIPNFYQYKYDPQIFIEKLITIMNKELLNYNIRLIEQSKEYKPNKNKSYLNFIKNNKIYPQTDIFSIFSTVTKHTPYSYCDYCKYCFNPLKITESYDIKITFFYIYHLN